MFAATASIKAEPPPTIQVHAKVVDWRGRPAKGSTVSVTVIRRRQGATAVLFRQVFKVENTDGQVVLEGPAGTWEIEAHRDGKRRGHTILESNVPRLDAPPEFSVTPSDHPLEPLVLKLRMAEWNEDNGTAVWQLDTTSPTQGQTFRLDELSGIPIR